MVKMGSKDPAQANRTKEEGTGPWKNKESGEMGDTENKASRRPEGDTPRGEQGLQGKR